jgi:hypothetical protein
MRGIFLVALIVSSTCTAEPFAFRDLSTGQSCAAARASEVSRGSKFERTETPDPREQAYHQHTFQGRLFDFPVEVHIGCIDEGWFRGDVMFDAHYVMKTPDRAVADAFMLRVISEFSPKYGVPKRVPTKRNRPHGPEEVVGEMASFGCLGDPKGGPTLSVLLRYPILTRREYEVWLSMTFASAVC